LHNDDDADSDWAEVAVDAAATTMYNESAAPSHTQKLTPTAR